LLSELDFQFSITALTETRITNLKEIDFNPNISGYVFEYVPTPMSAGDVGIYISENLDYTVVERTPSNPAFQALWIEILVPNKKNVICGVLYRQHNSPESFLSYFNETVERFNACDKTVYIAGDFNIDLLKSESYNYAHNFLLSLQSYSFIPLIDKPTRVYGNSATLIDNMLVNNTTNLLSCGNIISDISDHFSQFRVMANNLMKRSVTGFRKVRDFSHFSEVKFLAEVSNINWNRIISPPNMNTDKLFSKFYNKLNKVVNTHVPFKTVSKRRARQLSKPWITKGIRKSIKIKNSLYHSNFKDQYSNKITTLIRLSKKHYFHNYFQWNISSMKKTWAGISELINRGRKKMKNSLPCRMKAAVV